MNKIFSVYGSYLTEITNDIEYFHKFPLFMEYFNDKETAYNLFVTTAKKMIKEFGELWHQTIYDDEITDLLNNEETIFIIDMDDINANGALIELEKSKDTISIKFINDSEYDEEWYFFPALTFKEITFDSESDDLDTYNKRNNEEESIEEESIDEELIEENEITPNVLDSESNDSDYSIIDNNYKVIDKLNIFAFISLLLSFVLMISSKFTAISYTYKAATDEVVSSNHFCALNTHEYFGKFMILLFALNIILCFVFLVIKSKKPKVYYFVFGFTAIDFISLIAFFACIGKASGVTSLNSPSPGWIEKVIDVYPRGGFVFAILLIITSLVLHLIIVVKVIKQANNKLYER